MKYKMVIVMRTDLNMRKGKMIAQGAHAATMPFTYIPAWTDQDTAIKNLREWLSDSHMLKVCVRVDSELDLLAIEEKAKMFGVACYVITDAGFTEFGGVPTKTCLALGPDLNEKIDAITGGLKLL